MKLFSVRKFTRRLIKKWSLSLNKRLAVRRLSLIALLVAVICLSVVYYGLLFLKLNDDLKLYNKLPSNDFRCHSFKSNQSDLERLIKALNLNVNKKVKKLEFVGESSDKADPRILVLVETQYSKLGRSLVELLQYTKFRFDVELFNLKSLPVLTGQNNGGKYSLIVFENYNNYLQLSKWSLNSINQYCLQFNVGLIGFLINKEDKSKKIHQLKRSSLFIRSNLQIKDYHLNEQSQLLRITRSGSVIKNLPIKKGWTVFYFNQTNYKSVGLAFNSNNLVTTVVEDFGHVDGIRRVLFGNSLSFWLHKLVLLDSISYLTDNKLSLPLKRYLQIDIDDIFVGEKGTRLKANDVDALVDAQARLNKIVDEFQFNLGFSGKHLHRGNDDEDQGDDYLLKNAKKFRWFCHLFNHIQPHFFQNESSLENQMQLNKEFAQKHDLPIDTSYSIAPHHSGVYPIHEPLYDAWNKFGVKVTSTEEYQHLRPARFRKGFIFHEIQVLPRQTCGLYTHTIFLDKYPGGRFKLDDSIFGGELFFTFVFNPINIFMTHMSNYANDRIALYTFESAFKFIQCWTNLKFKTVKPVELADKYFKLYPEEKVPIWTNPCNDKRHLSIWSNSKLCNGFPDFLIIGPQKTGTTALHSFLKLHPSIRSNYPTKEYFEELQFFNGVNYLKGINWYLSKFPPRQENTTNKIKMFEKSANYFDNEKVPERVHSLLPSAKLIVILINPVKRAYSWYQHARSHKDLAAMNTSFYDVITSKTTTQFKQLRTLRNRSLNPGCYSTYLERWLQYFDKDQLIILDGDDLKMNPIKVMADLQLKLNLDEVIDYRQHLLYVSKKGFYCQMLNSTQQQKPNLQSTNSSLLSNKKTRSVDLRNGSTLNALNNLNSNSKQNETQNNLYNQENVQVKCLGKSKGRLYPEIDLQSINFLHKYYKKCNTMLFKLLVRLKERIPFWLLEELS